MFISIDAQEQKLCHPKPTMGFVGHGNFYSFYLD